MRMFIPSRIIAIPYNTMQYNLFYCIEYSNRFYILTQSVLLYIRASLITSKCVGCICSHFTLNWFYIRLGEWHELNRTKQTETDCNYK